MKSISNPREDQLRELLVGQSIVSATDNNSARLVLSNGVQLTAHANEGCGGCADGHYWLTHVATHENIITNVRIEETTDDHNIETIGVFVYSDAGEALALEFEGDPGSGWYGYGWWLEVAEP